MSELKSELKRLYGDSSKHSVYQNIPDFVSAELGYTESIDETWRSDRSRLAFLTQCRNPEVGETWLDFGANTGFFTLSLAYAFPQTAFVAVEANSNHARFMECIARHFGLDNVRVINKAVGLRELAELPRSDFMLHLNVLHHAGHDFDRDLVPARGGFSEYAYRYLSVLREITGEIFFQMGSNWGGDKNQPLIDMRADADKLELFSRWLQGARWNRRFVAYASRDNDGSVGYKKLETLTADQGVSSLALLDQFPGEFHRRPIFYCVSEANER